MFDIGWSQLLIVGVVAVVAIGPKELPNTMRALGRGVDKLRRMAGEFQGQFNQALKDANLEDVKRDFDNLRQSASSLSGAMNPVQLARNVLSAPASSTISSPTADFMPNSTSLSDSVVEKGEIQSLAELEDGEQVDIPSAFAPLAAFRR